MQISCTAKPVIECAADSLVVFVPEYEKLTDGLLKSLNEATGGTVGTLLEAGEFCGKREEIASVMHPSGYNVDRVILVGLGTKKQVDSDTYRRAAGAASRCRGLTLSESAIFHLPKNAGEGFYQAVIEGYLLGSYKLLEFKTGDDKIDKNKLTRITFATDDKRVLGKVEKAVNRGVIIAEGQMSVRTLAATPGNYLTPSVLAQTAQKLARQHKLKCHVLDEKAIERERMGALLAVAKGSAEPPRFVVLEYNGGRRGEKPVVLVGKGITFDSGGISLKPGLNMHEMKGDMTGAAVVLTVIVTAARLRLPLNLVSLLPACENLPSGTATRPGDIVTSRKGLTIEIINTDAEGRLILADALDYADRFKPQVVIDIATLTGASLYILGYSGAPVLGNNPALLERIKKASESTGEKTWPLPIWDDHREQMKSGVADLVNSGGRPAGTIAASAFLENFVGGWPWAHIDIAYVDFEPKGRPYIPKGPTGIGVRLLTEVLSSWKKM
ncbi:MAG: leucyl aminopeptidase [candidate division Zixibacteria bacterium]|nr:leucyl aminopeptidase [candidate division Zixibacteria bacterium]